MSKPLFFFLLSVLYTYNAQAQQLFVYAEDLNTQTPDASSTPRKFTALQNEEVYFIASDSSGYELWMNNYGSKSHMIADIQPGPGSGVDTTENRTITVHDSSVYFSAGDSSTGLELYKYNPQSGAAMAFDFNPGTASSAPVFQNDPQAFSNILYFTVTAPAYGTGRQLFEYEASKNTYIQITGPSKTATSAGDMGVILIKNKLYFYGYSATTGGELFVYDRSTGITTLALDMSPGTDSTICNGIYGFKDIDKVYFTAAPASGRKMNLYEYDGMNTPVNISDNLNPGNDYINIKKPFARLDELDRHYFIIYTSDHKLYSYGNNKLICDVGYPIDNLLIYATSLLFSTTDTTYRLLLNFSSSKPQRLNQLIDIAPKIEYYALPTSHWQPYSKNQHYFLYFSGAISKAKDSNKELCMMYDAAVSINEVVDKKISATIYPNPTTQDAMLEMTLDKAATLSVQLTDMQGRVLYKTENRQYAAGKHSATLPTRALAAGTYFYSVSDAHGALLQSGKLVKE